MRQVKSKGLTVRRLSLFLAAFSLLAAGCRDNPQDRAAKEVHQQIQAALAKSNTVAAQEHIQRAIATYRPTGAAQNSARLVEANLILHQGLSLQAELMLKGLPVRRAADALASELTRSQQLLLEKERIERMLALQDNEIAEYRALIVGGDQRPGLQARLAEAQNEKTTLLAQRQALVQQKDDIQAIINESQARSESLLRQADLAGGDQKLDLQKQAYALMLERTDDYVQVQAVENQISILDDKIALAQLQVDSLNDNIQQTQQAIDSIRTAENRRELTEQLAEIDTLLSEHQTRISALADSIKSELDAYRRTAQEAFELFEGAAEQYQRVRSGDTAAIATMRQADSLAYAAMVYAEQITFLRTIASRLTGIVAAADETLVHGLKERLPVGIDYESDLLETVIALFDKADQVYADAMEQARRIAGRGQEAASNVLKSRLVALYGKMRLADAIGQYDLASQVHVRLEELKEQGQEFGTLFTQSQAARLVETGLDFVPALPVNVELYFEGIRQRFNEWKQLATPDQQAEAVERNLAEMDELVRDYGDEMARLLEPLKREMLEAKEREFAAPAVAPGAPGAPGVAADPNTV